MSQDDNYTNIILEEIHGQNKAVLEAVGQMQDKMKTLATQESLNEIDANVRTIQRAVIDANKETDKRIKTLEKVVFPA